MAINKGMNIETAKGIVGKIKNFEGQLDSLWNPIYKDLTNHNEWWQGPDAGRMKSGVEATENKAVTKLKQDLNRLHTMISKEIQQQETTSG